MVQGSVPISRMPLFPESGQSLVTELPGPLVKVLSSILTYYIRIPESGAWVLLFWGKHMAFPYTEYKRLSSPQPTPKLQISCVKWAQDGGGWQEIILAKAGWTQ